MRLMLCAVVAILLVGCTPPPSRTAAPSRSGDAIAWTQFGTGETPDLIARALVAKGDDCPTIEWSGKAERMAVRAPDRAEAFGKLCQSRTALGEALFVRIWLGSTVLLEQQVTRQPERVAVIGDTGCRITYYIDQGCNDRKTWPFASVAASVVGRQPDLILHLGDYYYREVPCLASDRNCAPGPYGDREQTWRAEFFEPARPLIAKAPWVFARGNHEDCQRGGYGWAYYFGDGAEACEKTHAAAFIRLNSLTVVNFDTAQTGNSHLDADMNRSWEAVARALADTRSATTGLPILLMSHEPGYFVCVDKDKNVLAPCKESLSAGISGVRLLADSARRSGSRTILLSGHIHAFRSIDVEPKTLAGESVTQVIVGTGGANLDEDPTPPNMVVPAAVDATFPDIRRGPDRPASDKAAKWVEKDRDVVRLEAQGWTGFGFGMLTPSSLELAMFDAQGRSKFTCALADETRRRRCR